jgi:acetyl esterase/lipase
MCRSLLVSYPYLDSRRVAVLGSSYGAFLAGSLLAIRQERLIKCGVLLAPVVDWRLTGRFAMSSIVDLQVGSTVSSTVDWRLTVRLYNGLEADG